jgi:hypothetical protein
LLDIQHLKNSTDPLGFCGIATVPLSGFGQHLIFPRIPTSDSRDPRVRSASIFSTFVFFSLGILLMVFGECVLCYYIKFLINRHIVYSHGPTPASGHRCLPGLPPPASLRPQQPQSSHLTSMQKRDGGIISSYATLLMKFRPLDMSRVRVAFWLTYIHSVFFVHCTVLGCI